jgi:hypothetical protein
MTTAVSPATENRRKRKHLTAIMTAHCILELSAPISLAILPPRRRPTRLTRGFGGRTGRLTNRSHINDLTKRR